MIVGDRVRWLNKHGEWRGVITATSVGWIPEIYAIKFDNGQRVWVVKSSYLLPDIQDKVFVFR